MFSIRNITSILPFLLLAGGCVTAPLPQPPAVALPETSSAVKRGVKVELSVKPVKGGGEVVREGNQAIVSLSLTDAATGTPVTAMKPAVWIDLRKQLPGEPAVAGCQEKVKSYLRGGIAFRPDLDLNSYFIIVLNNDASISVIDPIRGMSGYSQLYGMINLRKPGEDWTFGPGERRLFVTMPKAGQVAVVDTATLKVVRNLDAGSSPVRIALQPDGKYLWVGNDSANAAESGVTVFDADGERRQAFLPTGAGSHRIAFSDDSLLAFVTNDEGGSVSVIDTQTLAKVADLKTGTKPVAVAWSPLAKALYVADEKEGTIAVIDGTIREVVTRIALEPGIVDFRLAPGGRFGFAVNPARDTLQVIDVSVNEVVSREEVAGAPYAVFFSDDFAYVRSRNTSELSLVTLAALGKGAEKLPLLKVPGGQATPQESSWRAAAADALSPTPEGHSVVFANPADATVLYYMEGMAIPMGSFSGYGRIPRAVSVINRSIRETSPGIYSAQVKIPRSGTYDVAVLLDTPRIVQCLDFTAAADPVLEKLHGERPVTLEFLSKGRTVKPGEPFQLNFVVKDRRTGQRVEDIRDLTVVAARTPSGWTERYRATPQGKGEYEVQVKVPQAGLYTLYFAAPSLRAGFNELPNLMLHAEREEGGKP